MKNRKHEEDDDHTCCLQKICGWLQGRLQGAARNHMSLLTAFIFECRQTISICQEALFEPWAHDQLGQFGHSFFFTRATASSQQDRHRFEPLRSGKTIPSTEWVCIEWNMLTLPFARKDMCQSCHTMDKVDRCYGMSATPSSPAWTLAVSCMRVSAVGTQFLRHPTRPSI